MGEDLPTVNLGSGRTAKAIVTGVRHTCALLDDNSLKCWGFNMAGELGLGDTTNRGASSGDYGMAALAPVDVGSRTISQLVTGAFHPCVLFDTGAVACWGDNQYGQLGIGTTDERGDEPSEIGSNL